MDKPHQELKTLREEIDIIDDKLVDLIVERSKIIRKIGKLKIDLGEIKSDDRIQEVLDRTTQRAMKEGISPSIAQEVFKTLMAQMVYFEVEELQNRDSF